MLEDEAASTPSPRRSPTPQPPPPRRSPTPLPTPPRRSPTPPPAPPTKKPSKRPTPQTKNQSPPAKKATVKPRAIPKIISEEKEEVTDAYKKDMSRFYDKLKKNQEARRNPEKPYFFVAPDILRKRWLLTSNNSGNLVSHPNQRYRTMIALSPSQLRRHRKRSGQGKALPNSDNKRTNQSPR